MRRLSLEAAVEELVADGDCIWIGNFGAQLFAVGDELVRQGRRDLHVVISSGGLLLDRLLAAGSVAEVTFAHCWSPVGPHPTRSFRDAWERGAPVTWHELPLRALAAALEAAASGVPFAPVAISPETGYVANGWSNGMLEEVDSPFGPALVVRALAPDTAFVHATSCDEWGNATPGAPAAEAPAAVRAASRSVVVTEELVEALGTATTIPGALVDVVVELPGAVAPDGVAGRYPRDVDGYLDALR